ncbi:MAG: hypothetical protein BroJett040_11940 [Oligoflexia bacterium]|nr:MAG: hypothetical protein BroJett040_11940 [Oligoflexia bacterium]
MKKKNIFVLPLSVLLVAGLVSKAQATCDEHYAGLIAVEKEKQLMHTMKSTGLTILTLLFPPAGIAKVGSVALSSKMTIDGVKGYASIDELERIQRIFQQAETEKGEDLEHVHRLVMQERPETSLAWVAREIRSRNIDEFYCTEAGLTNYPDLLMSLGVSEELAKKSLGLFGEVLVIPVENNNNAN